MQRQRDRDCSRPKTQEQKIGRQTQTHVETDKRDIKSLKQSRKNYKKRQGTWRETEAEERRVKQAETKRNRDTKKEAMGRLGTGLQPYQGSPGRG